MNFGLNKIDTDIRRKIYEETRDGKIHSKSEVLINKDTEKNREKVFERCLLEKKEQYKRQRKSKNDKEIIKVEYEMDIDSVETVMGNFLDVTK